MRTAGGSRRRSSRLSRLDVALACAFAASVALATPAVATPGRPVVAVFEIQASGITLSSATLGRLSGLLRTSLAASGVYQVVPRSTLRRELRRKKAESHRACYDRSCQIEIGRELAAKKLLATKIIALGKVCVVTAVLFDIRRATSEGGGRAEAGCSVDALTRAVRAIVGQLEAARPKRGRRAPNTPTAPSAPPARRERDSGPRSSTQLELRAQGGASFAVVLSTSDGTRRACPRVSRGKPCRLEALSPGTALLRVSSGDLHQLARTLVLGDQGGDPRLWVYALDRGSSTGAITLWVVGSVVAAIGIAGLASGLAAQSTAVAIAGGGTLLTGGGMIGLGFLPKGVVKAKREDYAVKKSSALWRLRLGVALHGRF